MQEFDNEEAYLMYQEEQEGIAHATRKYCESLGIEYEERYRHRLSRYIKSRESGYETPHSVTESPVTKEVPSKGYSAVDENGELLSPQQVCEKYNLPYKSLKDASLVAHTSKTIYNLKFSFDAEEQDLEGFKSDLISSISKLDNLPTSPRKSFDNSEDSYLLIIDIADLHIGKLGDKFATGDIYNSDIAVKRAIKGVEGILNKCQGFDIDQILLVGGNDAIHIDGPGSKTTKGTHVDSCENWYSSFIRAQELYIQIINKLKNIANVHYVHNVSNHDETLGTCLAQVIQAYFNSCEDVTFDVDMRHRKYYTYHDNLIGLTHGDKAKTSDLGALMADESPDWSKCKNRYIFYHHIHHKVSKDHIGVTVESVRSPSGSDRWHSAAGYVGVPKAVEAFLHDKQKGQFCRLTYRF